MDGPAITTSRSTSSWLRRGLIAAAVVVALAFGGPFAYIHVVQGDAPEALTVGGASADPSVDPTLALDGDWTVTSGSEAGYRVVETLMGQPTEGVGRTSAVSGGLTVAGDEVSRATFTVDLTSVTSDSSQRDSQFQRRIMATATYPDATFTLTSPIDTSALPRDGRSATVRATGDLTLHGTTRSETVTLTAKRAATGIQISASVPVTFADYGIANPSAGPAQTEDHGTIELLVVLVKA